MIRLRARSQSAGANWKAEIEELYDLEADPGERLNLALEPSHLSRLREFRQRLDAELRRTGGEALADSLPQPVEVDR